MHVVTPKKPDNNVLTIKANDRLASMVMARAMPRCSAFRDKSRYNRKVGRSARRKGEW